MPDILGMLGDTVKSVGGALGAPYGLAFDLATSPFDDQDDNIGTLAAKFANRAGNVLDPFGNQETFTGLAFGKTMETLDDIYREGISEPIATVNTMLGHAAYDPRKLADMVDPDKWAQAYQIAQHRSIGQSYALELPSALGGLTGNATDPLDPEAYDRFNEWQPVASTLMSGTSDFVARWYLDPGVVIGKAAGAYRAGVTFRHLGREDRLRLFDTMMGKEADKLTGLAKPLRFVVPGTKAKAGIATRTDSYLDFVGGQNVLGRQLNAAEIYAATPELRRSYGGRTIAGLLDDAHKLDDPRLVRDTQRRILAVAGGDPTQIARLHDEIVGAGAIADTLENLRKAGTLDLKTLALDPKLAQDPAYVANLERQLQNLNDAGQVDGFIKGYISRLDVLKSTDSQLDMLPGVHNAGNRALKRETGTRSIDKLNEKLSPAYRTEAQSSVFQKSVNNVPVVVVRTVGNLASPYTKLPVKVADAIRQTHYVGVADLHDWNGAVTQLDSMMRVAEVDDATRLKALSESFLAKTEVEKQRAINRIENLSMKTLASTYSTKLGRDIDRDYIEQLMMKGTTSRQQHLSSLRGRAYAATENAAGKGSKAAQQDMLRVDQIADDGTPLALPLLSTQLANSVPLVDIHLAKSVLGRTEKVEQISQLSKAWKAEARNLTGLQRRLKLARAGQYDRLQRDIEKTYERMDMLIDAGQLATRVWKFGVLFRLGYPMRVLMDDHMRIWSQLNAGTFYFGDNLKEFGQNLRWNKVNRQQDAVAGFKSAQAERFRLLKEYGHDEAHSREDFDAIVGAVKTLRSKKADPADVSMAEALLTKLDPEGKIASYYHREIDLAKLRRKIAGKQGAIKKWEAEGSPEARQKIEDAKAYIADKEGALRHLSDQQPTLSPESIRNQLETLNSQIDQGVKAFKADKRTVGSADVVLPGGYKANGAFAGPVGKAWLEASSSNSTFTYQMQGVEDRLSWTMGQGSHRVLQNNEPGHLDAWADVLNHQFKMSPEAMFFVKGKGGPDEFTAWLHEPAQAHLRERVAHFAHDPEDWGHRIEQMVDEYLPTEQMRDALIHGHISPKQLSRWFPDQNARPAIHGQAAAVNLGGHVSSRVIGDTMNRTMKFLGELPTDRLSRHPFFNSLYRTELRELHETRRYGYQQMGREYTQADVQELERIARQKALSHMKQTLFDMSAHSHAAHVMRFLSPFFAAHQESLSRWWRIASENPAVIRRFQQGFDMPRKLGLVYDVETGEPVKDGESISAQHRILLRVPEQFGGKDTRLDKWLLKMGGDKYWSVNENGFNLILQGGLMNPGVGPLVSVPIETLVQKYAEYPEIERMARILNPYPPDSPLDGVTPAWLQRAHAFIAEEHSDEWARRFESNKNEIYIEFREANGREPTDAEVDALMERAGRETNRDLFLMFLNNAVSPAPAKPESKYSVIQHGWYQIRSKAEAEGRDYEWMLDQFKAKYGDTYLAMVYSNSLNPARLTGTAGEVSAMKTFAPLLNNIDPKLARMVVGPAAALAAKDNESLGEYNSAARTWMENQKTTLGSEETYLSHKEPREALLATMVRDGWDKYTALTGALTASAQQMGLSSYEESDQLVEAKRLGIQALMEENFAWKAEYENFDKGKYDTYLLDMQQIANDPTLSGDTERGDITALRQYLALRGMVDQALEARRQAGLPYTEAAADNKPLMQAFAAAVGYLREQSPFFDDYGYNGVIEMDPYLRAAQGDAQ